MELPASRDALRLTVADLRRPDLPHLQCPLCLEAFQDPGPPPWPSRRYRLSEGAFTAYQEHLDGHPLTEHLGHAQEHGIPFVCEGCGGEWPVSVEGWDDLLEHHCRGRAAATRER